MDDVFLFVVSLGVTLLGLAGSWRAGRRRGTASAMRGAAWSLVPMAAYLTGLTAWAADLVFSPVKWAGIALLGLAGVLYVVSGAMLRRGAHGTGRDMGKDTGKDTGKGTRRGRPAAARGGETPAEQAIEPRRSPDLDPDLADIENILRRRGIS